MMAAVWFRARAELRQRWQAWLAIAVLLGTFGGATAAVAAGARRTATAYPRFLEQARSFDVFLGDFSVFAPDLFWKPDFDAIERSDLVERTAETRYFFGTEDDEVIAPEDDAFLNTINRPKMLAGRLPVAVDEVSMPFAWDRPGPRRIGDRVKIGFDVGPGELELTIVGIHAMPGDFPPTDLLGQSFIGSVRFFERYRDVLSGTEAMFIRLTDEASEADLESMFRSLAGGKLTNVYRNVDQAQNVQRSFDLQAVALWLLAGGLGLATLLVIGQSVARQASLESGDRAILSALGMSRPQLIGTVMVKALAAGVLAAVLAVVAQVAASPLFPRGTARIAEPDPGITIDVTVAAAAVLALILISLVGSAIPLVRARRSAALPTTPSRAATIASRLGSPPATVAGVRFALEAGRGERAVPVRSTITAVALGLAALTAAFSFATNLDTLLASPGLYGRGWDHEYGFGGDFSAVPTSAIEAARTDPSVEAAALGTLGLIFDLHVPGRDVIPVTGMALAERIKGSVLAAPSEGRYPGRGEIALGPRTMDLLDLQVGDRIRIGLQGADAHPVMVAGRIVLPPFAEQSQFGDGVLIGFDTLLGELAPDDVDDPPPADQLLVRFDGSRPLREQIETLRGKLENVDQDFTMIQAADLVNFGRVQNLPLVLAGLLAALASGALAHVLLTAIRRRRRDVAILKTLGFNRRQARRTIAWQASTVVAVALAIGIPLGIVAGRALWSLFASRVYVLVDQSTPWIAIAVMVPAALLLANLIAAWPARSAARTNPATALRAE